ncbi:NAD(P)H-dependent oxidoreductase [Brachybacterium sacelli]|uniref:Homoserine dehydrogenase-like protein n=1 Tax=Brachybacterium sacelli TaxID=173364 RepID=A0ABS4WYU2_9MICO|nr:Gfo/Idh/MocA family oxidoreductase [Brachybacterium sacelli]MBP2381379.1 putative homoserine dehydrogenase-like protein [Brachybacterium sacelli]
MNLHELLRARADVGTPLKIGLIGAGRYGTMFLAQVRNTPGMHVVGIADINTPRAEGALELVDWPADQVATSVEHALSGGGTAVVGDAGQLLEADLDVVVEATGNPIVGTDHALRAIRSGKHIIMVTVEADALCGPALALEAKKAGVVYSLAYGDQPALIWELVDWARTSGFTVTAAGKGAKYLPHYHQMNPDTVWDNWEFSKELTDSGQLNPYMHTSFRDGTKAAIEMAAVANAASLFPSDDGLSFTPGDVEQIATICRPEKDGGVLAHNGSVDVMSSVTREGHWIDHNIQEGVFVVVEATNDYVAGCFTEYPWHPDPSGRYAALYRPYHYVGLELGISIANAALRGVATGSPAGFYADVVATAKKDLTAGEVLDGEGGYCVYGKLISAEGSVVRGALPVALAHSVPLTRNVAAGEIVTWEDVEMVEGMETVLEMREATVALMARAGSSVGI